jgi:hypothetical protein
MSIDKALIIKVMQASFASIASIACVISQPAMDALGPCTFLAPMLIVFAHPAQRTDLCFKTVLKTVLGTAAGVS